MIKMQENKQKKEKDPKDFMKKKHEEKSDDDKNIEALMEAIKEASKHAESKDERKTHDEKAHDKKHEAGDEGGKEKSAEDKDAKIAELTDMVKRTQAEFINFKNRTEKETKQMLEYSTFDVMKKMLPIIDSFEQALKNEAGSEFKKGVEMVYAQLMDVMKAEGVKPIDCIGKKFNPYYHEVMIKEKSDKAEDVVLEEFQKGYMMKERVLRYSKVKVSG
ncbi:MAG: nucleotide exchange factor GrpE [Candidatus Woesearchaeota archaeon]|nr:nucleotide exchange factor GrpE [Candidatus Woesearchaeota archaeon]